MGKSKWTDNFVAFVEEEGEGNHAQDHEKLEDHSCSRSDRYAPPPHVIKLIRKKRTLRWTKSANRTERSAARLCYVTAFIKSKKSYRFPWPRHIIWLSSRKGCKCSEHWREGTLGLKTQETRISQGQSRASPGEVYDPPCSEMADKELFSCVERPPSHTSICLWLLIVF